MSEVCTYVHVSPCGTPYYVGAGKLSRARNFTRGKDKYLEAEDFVINGRRPYVIIYEADNRGTAFEFEKELIARYGRMDNGTGILYNRTDGPGIKEGHREPPSDLTRALVAAANRRRVWTQEQLNSMRIKSTGRKHSVASREIMRKKAMGHTVPQEMRERISAKLLGNIPWNKGRKCSEEEKIRISKSAIERCARMRAQGIIVGGWNKGKKHTAETREKLSIAQKARRAREAQDRS